MGSIGSRTAFVLVLLALFGGCTQTIVHSQFDPDFSHYQPAKILARGIVIGEITDTGNVIGDRDPASPREYVVQELRAQLEAKLSRGGMFATDPEEAYVLLAEISQYSMGVPCFIKICGRSEPFQSETFDTMRLLVIYSLYEDGEKIGRVVSLTAVHDTPFETIDESTWHQTFEENVNLLINELMTHSATS